MTMKRVHVGFTPVQMRLLKSLAAKLGLDLNNTIRYCISRVAEQESISLARSPGGEKRR
jgi:hypothetical protein